MSRPATPRALAALLPLLALAACKKDKEEEIDTTPPGGTLELDTPAPGAWSAEGALTAEGSATNVESVTVAGSPATMTEAGGFTAPITLTRGINLIEASAVDLRGDTLFVRHGVLAGEFGEPDGAVEDAVTVRVNQAGLDKVCELAASMIDDSLVAKALPTLNPVMDEELLGITFLVNLDSLTFSAPRIAITPSPSTVRLTATLPDVNVAATVYADAGWLGATDFGLGMTASEAVIDADVILAAADGEIGVTLTSTDVALNDFAYTLSFVPDWLTDFAFVDTVRGQVESLLVDQITSMVPPLLDETLAGLDPSFSTDLMGRTVDLAFSFAEIEPDDDGLALTLDLDVDFPSSGDHTYAGYLTAPYGVPEVDRRADLAAAISDNLLNLVLFEAWRSGILELTMSTADGSLDPLLLTDFKASEGTISTWASLPPVIVEKEGGLVAQVGELLVTVETPDGELGHHLVVAIAGEVPVELAIRDGELVLDLGTPALTMMVRESDWGASDDTVTRLIESALPLDTLLALLGNLSFPLPTLYGVSIDIGSAARDADGVHTDAVINLR